jgi:hypothetical protein
MSGAHADRGLTTQRLERVLETQLHDRRAWLLRSYRSYIRMSRLTKDERS